MVNDGTPLAGSPDTSFDAFVFDHVASLDHPFTIAQIAQAVLEGGAPVPGSAATEVTPEGGRPKLERLVTMSLLKQNLVFTNDGHTFTPRPLYYRGARLLIIPRAEEIERRALIPGHRFEPFLCPLLRPWEAVLVGPEDDALPKAVTEWDLEVLAKHHVLLGISDLPIILVSDREENATRLGTEADNPLVLVTAFDLTHEVEAGMRAGDALLCTLEDWRSGRFSFRPVSAGELAGRAEERSRWIECIEFGFLRAFDLLGTVEPIGEQIADAYWYAGADALVDPRAELGELVTTSTRISVQRLGTDDLLWHIGQEASEAAERPDPVDDPVGLDGSLEEILADTGIALSPDEIEAYARDELSHGFADPERVATRALLGRRAAFHGDAQEQAFRRLVAELFDRARADYDPEDDRIVGSIREQALALADRDLAWLRSLDSLGFEPREIPSAEISSLAGHARFLSMLITATNQLKDSTLERESVAKLMEGLQFYERTAQQIRAKAERKIQKVITSHRRSQYRGRGRRPKPSAMVVLMVTLRHVNPPIWRRIVVPDSYTLLQLHAVIQEAMGWTDSHLHLFKIGEEVYSDPSTDNFGDFDYADEQEYRLSAVLPRIGRIFHYEYDYGDNWQHTIKVEKRAAVDSDAPPAATKPMCIGGSRACPPEDCGGVGGYRELIAALRAPASRRNEDMSQTVRWAGEWDPESFDVIKANRRIKDLLG